MLTALVTATLAVIIHIPAVVTVTEMVVAPVVVEYYLISEAPIVSLDAVVLAVAALGAIVVLAVVDHIAVQVILGQAAAADKEGVLVITWAVLVAALVCMGKVVVALVAFKLVVMLLVVVVVPEALPVVAVAAVVVMVAAGLLVMRLVLAELVALPVPCVLCGPDKQEVSHLLALVPHKGIFV
jgi:hypothetical protein